MQLLTSAVYFVDFLDKYWDIFIYGFYVQINTYWTRATPHRSPLLSRKSLNILPTITPIDLQEVIAHIIGDFLSVHRKNF